MNENITWDDTPYAPKSPPKQEQEDTTLDLNAILNMNHQPLQFAVDKILPQGLFLLAGSPKVGNSWLILDMCISIATGGNIWGYNTPQAEVLYFALEDNYRRINDRVLALKTEDIADYSKFRVSLSAQGINTGLLEQISNHMERYPNTSLIVIDTFEHIRDKESHAHTLYSSDYTDVKSLRAITNKYDITLMLVHHTRKMKDDDPINTISGSTGLTGATDGNWVLEKVKRTENNAKLTIDNRDTEGFCFDLRLENCRWRFLGKNTGIDSEDEDFALLIDDYLTTINKSEWQGTPTALTKALAELDNNPNLNAQKVSKTLNKISTLLEQKYHIKFHRGKSNGSIKITLTRIGENANENNTAPL